MRKATAVAKRTAKIGNFWGLEQGNARKSFSYFYYNK